MEVQGRRKRGRLRRKEGDGNESTGEKEERSTTWEEGDGNGSTRGEGREEHYGGRREMGMKVQGRRNRGTLRRKAMGMKVQGRRKRGTLRRKEGDGNGSTREKEERNTT